MCISVKYMALERLPPPALCCGTECINRSDGNVAALWWHTNALGKNILRADNDNYEVFVTAEVLNERRNEYQEPGVARKRQIHTQRTT